MPRYFFDILDGTILPDDTGTELTDPTRAQYEALRFLSSYVADHPELVRNHLDWRLQVRDNNGCVLFSVVMLTVGSDGRDIASCPHPAFGASPSGAVQ